jgi:hypothetical protein
VWRIAFWVGVVACVVFIVWSRIGLIDFWRTFEPPTPGG